jgi:undecaprenyl-phosphate galactose phosphotransferase/putative colanic acid biosynthesis UDP-glucose lipid carrier transferase
MIAIRNIGSARAFRVVDVLLACLVIAFFLPLMAMVALALRADGSGPVLSRRVRICRNGQWIQTFAFRTAANRRRGMTCVHRFIRWTRIDTLPQAINVLRGDLRFIDW